jgi:hypothetical protein
VQAVAGAGKTYLLENWLLPELQGEVLYLAFNNHIIEEAKLLKPKFPNLSPKTISSLSHDLLAVTPRLGLDWKFKHFRQYFPTYKAASAAVKLMEYIQNTKPLPSNKLSAEVITEAGIDVLPEQVPLMLKKVRSCLKELRSDSLAGVRRLYNHTDIMWLAAYYPSKDVRAWKWIVLDEVQDLNPTEQAVLTRLLANAETRCFVVGDPEQILYGFKGVKEEAVTSLSAILQDNGGLEVFASNISRRCPKSHVRLAQFCVPAMQHVESAEEGILRRFPALPLAEMAQPRTMFLSYLAAPMIRVAYELIQAGTPAAIVGEASLHKELVHFLTPHKQSTSEKVIQLSKTEFHETKENLLASGNGPRIGFYEEFHKTVVALLELMSVEAALAFVEEVFKDSAVEGTVHCATIHKSKGSTCDHAWLLLNAEPSSEMTPAQRHILYVSLTRAKKSLNLVHDAGGLSVPAEFLALLPALQ